MVCLIPLYACCEFFRQVKTLEDELHIATNNLRGLEIGEEKASQREDSSKKQSAILTKQTEG
ncbi:Hypothetical predicted protein, partial [Mytilus galloprovincialis]